MESFLEYWESYTEELYRNNYDGDRSKESAMKDFENGIPAEDAAKYFLEERKKKNNNYE